MAERPEDLNLPNAVVTRIVKDALPTGISVAKDARQAISKAASVFVLYATSCANNNALKCKRKTISSQDVFQALEDMELESFIEPLKATLEAHKLSQSKKVKKTKPSNKAKETETNPQPNGDDGQMDNEQDAADYMDDDNERAEDAHLDTSS